MGSLHTLPAETVEGRMLIERFYNDAYENHYEEIYKILTDSNKITLTEEERYLIISTVVTMFYRTSKWMNALNTFYDQILEYTFALADQTGSTSFVYEGEEISIAGRTLEEMQKEMKGEIKPGMILSQLNVALKLIDLRHLNDRICVHRLLDDEYGFITSDNPVCVANDGQQHIMPGDPGNTLFLPLDEKHILFLKPVQNNNVRHTITRFDRKGVDCIVEKLYGNIMQSKNADKYVLGSDKSLKDLIKDKEKY